MDAVINWVNSLVGGNARISSVLVSLIPLIELKGGILFARESGLMFFEAFIFPYLGSTAVFFPIFFLLKPILNLLKKIKWFNKFALKVEGYFARKAEDVKNKRQNSKLSETFIKALGVFIFVAVPLPMTGIWTGTAIAVFLGLKFKEAVLPVMLCNVVAGLIISALAALFLPYVDYILLGLLVLAFVFLIAFIVKIAVAKPRGDGDNKE